MPLYTNREILRPDKRSRFLRIDIKAAELHSVLLYFTKKTDGEEHASTEKYS